MSKLKKRQVSIGLMVVFGFLICILQSFFLVVSATPGSCCVAVFCNQFQNCRLYRSIEVRPIQDTKWSGWLFCDLHIFKNSNYHCGLTFWESFSKVQATWSILSQGPCDSTSYLKWHNKSNRWIGSHLLSSFFQKHCCSRLHSADNGWIHWICYVWKCRSLYLIL